MRWSVALVLVSSFFMAQASAQAQSIYSPPGATPLRAEAPATSSQEVEVINYNRKVVIADSVAGGLFLGGIVTLPSCLSSESGCDASLGLLIASLGTYSLAPAAVHLSEGKSLTGLASMTLRVGLPILGGYAFSAGGDDSEGAGLGVLVGIGAAIAIDWAVLSKKERVRAPQRTAIVPTAAPTNGGATVGVGGSF